MGIATAAARRWRLIAAAIAALALIAGLWYVLENPFSQTWGHTVTQVPLHQKYVALTFDDGPNPPYTDEIVDYLHEQHVTATFFVVGRAVVKYPDVVRREAEYGDAIGNHSWDHAHLVLERRPHIARELKLTDEAIFAATGQHTRLFRPPFGARDYAVIQVAHQLGYEVIMWSVPLPRDWSQPKPETIAKRVLKYVKDGSIVVLHDGNRGIGGDRHNTVEATKLIVAALKREGFAFVTVPQLLNLGYAHEVSPPGPAEYNGDH